MGMIKFNAKKLHLYLVENNIVQSSLAEKVGMTPQGLGRIVLGKIKTVSTERLYSILFNTGLSEEEVWQKIKEFYS